MDRAIAEKLMAALMRFTEPFNDITELTGEITDERERKDFRRPLGEIGVRLYTAMLPIIRQYPDLDPDKDEPWYRAMISGERSV